MGKWNPYKKYGQARTVENILQDWLDSHYQGTYEWDCVDLNEYRKKSLTFFVKYIKDAIKDQLFDEGLSEKAIKELSPQDFEVAADTLKGYILEAWDNTCA